jgi:hypothetical protein
MKTAAALALLALLPQEPKSKPALSAAIDSAVSRAAPVAGDGEFLRRVKLDLVGYPPTAEETKAFAADPDPQKRTAKIDALLATDDWADYWSRLFAESYFGNYHDVRMDTQPKVSRASSARIVGDFVKWFRMKLVKDRPYTEIVAEMLDARGTDEGDPALAYKLALYNEEGAESEFATNVSRHFLGIRLLCAKCHDHPFDQWTVVHFWGLAAFNVRQRVTGIGGSAEKDAVDRVKLDYRDTGEAKIYEVEIDSDAVRRSASGEAKPVFLYGGQAPPGPGVDRMKVLVPLLTGKANTQLPRALANRVWGWLFGRGIVTPVDDFAARRNKPVNASLLESLTRHTAEKRTSIKELVRGICASDVYQLSTASDTPVVRADFSRGLVKQLNGEQLVHSLQVATKGKAERNVGATLKMIESLWPPGAVWCETTPLPGNAKQALLLRNNQEILGWITGGGVLSRIKSGAGTVDEKIDEMFLAALSRRAGDAERARYRKFLEAKGSWEDAYWAVLNTTEFVTRH